MHSPDDLAKRRPAEVSGVAGAVALLLAHLLGVTDADTIVALAIVVGVVPAAVTFVVHLLRSRHG
jgi:hypothetical protein